MDSGRNRRRCPDVAFVSSGTWPLERAIPETGDWEVVPDLALEVISPTELFDEVYKKMEEYFSFGVRQVWIVSPGTQKIHVYDSPNDGRIFAAESELDCAPLLPGLRLPVSSIFQRQTTPPSETR